MALALTVLGCSAIFSRPGQPCSGYLMRSDQAAVWVDCGSGTFAALQEHIQPEELSAVWVSHLHPDHSADLLTAFNWAVNTSNAPRLPVYGPLGWATRLAAMLPNEGGDRMVSEAFQVHELRDGHTAEVGDLVLRSRAVRHSVPAFGLRVERDDRVLAYSGDSGPCPALVELSRGADLFVCEAALTEPAPTHCTPQDAGRLAAQGDVRRLLLTHLAHALDERDAVRDAAEAAGCPTESAAPNLELAL